MIYFSIEILFNIAMVITFIDSDNAVVCLTDCLSVCLFVVSLSVFFYY